MTLQIGIVLPRETERDWIVDLQCEIDGFRKDQAEHFENLLLSWRIFRSFDALPLINKAVRRTLRDRP